MTSYKCGSCRELLYDADGHSECVACLGRTHTEAGFTEMACTHCESRSLALLHSLMKAILNTYSKEHFYSPHYHENEFPTHVWQTTIWKTIITCHLTSGLESYPRWIEWGYSLHRTRLLTTVCSQTTSLKRYYSDFGAGLWCSRSPVWSTNTACKRSRGNGFSS